MDCRGYGTTAWHGEVVVCPNCDRSEYGRGFCSEHICRRCVGKGVVCPRCRGMRFLAEPTVSGNRAVRCETCCEGNNVSMSKEMGAIMRELARVESPAIREE